MCPERRHACQSRIRATRRIAHIMRALCTEIAHVKWSVWHTVANLCKFSMHRRQSMAILILVLQLRV